MDKKLLLIPIFLFLSLPVFAQTIPQPEAVQTCDQMLILNRIQQEHQLTRKFFVDTYNQKSTEFFTEADKRMAYLENLYETEMRNAVLKLGFLWLFIALFVQATFGFFRILWKKRSYKKMRDDIANDVYERLHKEIKDSTKVRGTAKPVLETKEPETKPTMPAESQDKIRMEELMAKLDSMKA